MRQTYTDRQAVRAGTDTHHGKSRHGRLGPRPSDHRNGKDEPGVRLRLVAAPGGVAFVNEPSTTGGGSR